MLYTRAIKFQYYTMYSKVLKKNKWVDNGRFDFVKWLLNFETNKLVTKTIEFDGTKARIDNMDHDSKNGLWSVRFMKLRDNNIPSKVKENEEAKAIELLDDEYIGEDLTLLYCEKTGIAMIQSNRFALGITKLENFVNKNPLIKDEQVKLVSISHAIDLKQFKRKRYRTFELKFANMQRLEPSGKTPLGDIMKSFKKFGGLTGTVTISLGRSKIASLNNKELEDAFAEIIDNDCIDGARLKVKDDDDSPVEIIDLFDNVYNDIIQFNLEARTTLNYHTAVNMMTEKFNERLPNLKKLIPAK